MSSVDIKQLNHEAQQLPWWQRNLYLVMVVGAIVVALLLVAVAMRLYSDSEAFHLDLSRPDYQEVRDQVGRDYAVSSFSPTGPLTPAVMDEFERKYDESLGRMQSMDAFSVDALSDDALSLPSIVPES